MLQIATTADGGEITVPIEKATTSRREDGDDDVTTTEIKDRNAPRIKKRRDEPSQGQDEDAVLPMIHPRRVHHLTTMMIRCHPRHLGHVRDLVDERGELISGTNDPRKGDIVIIGAGTGNQMIIQTTHRIRHLRARTE